MQDIAADTEKPASDEAAGWNAIRLDYLRKRNAQDAKKPARNFACGIKQQQQAVCGVSSITSMVSAAQSRVKNL